MKQHVKPLDRRICIIKSLDVITRSTLESVPTPPKFNMYSGIAKPMPEEQSCLILETDAFNMK